MGSAIATHGFCHVESWVSAKPAGAAMARLRIMAADARDPIAEARRQWEAHGWAPAADGMEMVTSLFRAQQLLHARIDSALRAYDLSFARYEILRLLAFSRSGSLPMTRLGSLLQVHAASVTSAVSRLETQGHVVRTGDAGDRRVVRAAITDSGRTVVEAATGSLNREIFEQPGVSRRDVRGLIRLLRAVRSVNGDAT